MQMLIYIRLFCIRILFRVFSRISRFYFPVFIRG
jgi:hypothetical protein